MERTTRQRTAIRKAITVAGRPLSPPEVLAAAQAEVPGLGLATVYRSLKGLLDEGVIATVSLPGGLTCYETAHLDHHHHFHCRGCGKVFEVDGCPGDLRKLAPRGFKLEEHEIVLYGRCAACAKR